MKTAQEHLIEAVTRAAASGAVGPRAATPVSAADAEGWLSSLAQGLRGSELGGAALRPTSSSEQQTGGQLLAAAHAVAAYWQSAGQLLNIAAETAAHSSGDSQAPIIRVTHVTAEGGLAAVELVHPDLGALAIEVSLSGRTLSVLATAETEHAAAAIREGQAALAQKLEAQGIVLQTLQVVVLRRRAPNSNSKSRKDS
ncbi:MAG TPA: flagellar hook-length control protein FliK [Polyangiales bacterium]|nr:flagellar hook-length control protein FliK [Polyangiales bacterium]